MTEVRRQLLEQIAEISQHYPEMRLGQLIANLTTHALSQYGDSIWDVEDEEMLPAARELANTFRERAATLLETHGQPAKAAS